MAFKDPIQLIRNGEPVAAGVPNRPLATLDENVRYLYSLLQAASTGSTVFARQVTVEPEANVGMAVYYNAANQRFERALAQVTIDPVSSQLMTAESAEVWGVVHSKSNSTLADLLLYGYTDLDLTAALDTDQVLTASMYYLSTVSPGKLIVRRPPTPVMVLRADGNGKVFVSPQWLDLASNHTHWRFDLYAQPAGTVNDPGPGGRINFLTTDDSLPGWLPAQHAIFAGKAPHGAAFGYNLSAHQALKDAWPPLPPENAVLERGMGGTSANGLQGVPTGSTGLVVMDNNGIWWMSDCSGDQPWPADLDKTYSQSMSPECPADLPMQLVLWFTKLNFITDTTVVTSLVSADDRIIVECAGAPGTPAQVGALQLRLDLDLLVADTGDTDYQAVKTFNTTTQTLQRGNIVSGLVPLSGNVELTVLDGQGITTGSGTSTAYHGKLGISLVDVASRELFVQLVRLDGVLEQYINDTMYLSFPLGELTSYRGRIHVPSSLTLVGSAELALRLRLLSLIGGNLPDDVLTVTARVIPGGALKTPADLPLIETAWPLDLTSVDFGTVTTAPRYLDVQTFPAPIMVVAGDDVLFTVTRDASVDDGYAGEIGIMRQAGLVIVS